MNHLYWPKVLLHAPKSVEAFQKCLALQKATIEKTGKSHPHFIRTYLGLGDAYVKDKKFENARAIWREAQTFFPGNPYLKQRLEITDDKALTAFVDDVRGLGSMVNTDLSILWHSESVYRDIFEKRGAKQEGL
jgi:hypothetical protein